MPPRSSAGLCLSMLLLACTSDRDDLGNVAGRSGAVLSAGAGGQVPAATSRGGTVGAFGGQLGTAGSTVAIATGGVSPSNGGSSASGSSSVVTMGGTTAGGSNSRGGGSSTSTGGKAFGGASNSGASSGNAGAPAIAGASGKGGGPANAGATHGGASSKGGAPASGGGTSQAGTSASGTAGASNTLGLSCGGLRMVPMTCGTGQFCDYDLEDICGAADAPGTCRIKPEICTADYAPVCGCDGKTYSNKCSANAEGVSVSTTGACK